MKYEINEILLGVNYYYKGDWIKCYNFIKNKERLEDTVIEEAKAKTKCKYVTIMDENYPKALNSGFHPPFVLYYYGDLSLLKKRDRCLAIIGALNLSNSAKRIEREVIEKSNDIIFVTNLNDGAGKECIRECIKNNKKVVIVLNTGINYPVQFDFSETYYKVLNEGLIISEYPIDTFPPSEELKKSNRIISAVSKGVFFPEIDSCTPSAILYDAACYNNGRLYAVPHDIYSEDTFSNKLIRNGATIVLEPRDILEDY